MIEFSGNTLFEELERYERYFRQVHTMGALHGFLYTIQFRTVYRGARALRRRRRGAPKLPGPRSAQAAGVPGVRRHMLLCPRF